MADQKPMRLLDVRTVGDSLARFTYRSARNGEPGPGSV